MSVRRRASIIRARRMGRFPVAWERGIDRPQDARRAPALQVSPDHADLPFEASRRPGLLMNPDRLLTRPFEAEPARRLPGPTQTGPCDERAASACGGVPPQTDAADQTD